MKQYNIFDEHGAGKIARHNLKANVTYLDGHGVAKTGAFLLSKNNWDDTFGIQSSNILLKYQAYLKSSSYYLSFGAY